MILGEQVICHFSLYVFHPIRMITCRNSVLLLCGLISSSDSRWYNQREISGKINSSWCVKIRVTEFQIHTRPSKQGGEYQHGETSICLFAIISVWFEAGCWFPSQFECSCDTRCTNYSSISAQLSIFYLYTVSQQYGSQKWQKGTLTDWWCLPNALLEWGPFRLGFALENDLQLTFWKL